MICSSCRAPIREGSSVCGNCGLALTSGETVALTAAVGSSVVSRPIAVHAGDEGRFLPGTLIGGRYRIVSLLGRGGMGEVYRATDLTLAQPVALKFLPEAAAGSERLLERFHNEVRVARQVSHPNVCRVYDIGQADGLPFISMEYVDGEDLASLLARIGRLPSDKALEIARKLCAGIAAAHERGVIHRDLKPHNVMLNRRGEAVIMDFGLAAIAQEIGGPEARNGTPAYMAPEQLRGESATARSDIYALGLIIYELFTGKRAWDSAASIGDLLAAQEQASPVSITSVVSDADPAVEKVILRCLQPDPLQRPATALSVAGALPGGDPLAAALAAGETPSPELVAASGEKAGIRLRYALVCLAAVLAGLAAAPHFRHAGSLLAMVPFQHPREVLEVKAHEMAAALGYADKPVDTASWFFFNGAYRDYLQKRTGKKDWRALFTGEEAYRFTYRQSPEYLETGPDGNINDTRPAMTVPGMVLISTDSRGRLRRFEGVAPRWNGSDPPTPFDPAHAFRLAGFDIAKFAPAEPQFALPLAADTRYAWKGMHPDVPDLPVTVEMTTWRGKLTAFNVIWPWMGPDRDTPKSFGLAEALGLLTLVSAAIGFLCVVFFARRNLLAGRGDRKGALRIGVVMLAIYLAEWVLRAHWMPRESMLGFLVTELGSSFLASTVIALLYLAIEPSVRARWPRSLITWNRVLAGDFNDARVGSHIVIGAAMGMLVMYLFVWRASIQIANGSAPINQDLTVFLSVRYLLAAVLNVITGAVITGFVIFFCVSGVRAVARYDWLAALIAAILLSLQEGGLRASSNIAQDLPIYIAIFASFTFLLLRMGLVPAISAIFVINLCSRIPSPPSLDAWYTPHAIFLSLLVAGLAVFGFWRSQTAHPRTA